MTPAELRRRRATAQLLAGGAAARPAAEVVRHLLAVQAQDLRSTRLALLARRADSLDAAMERGELVCAWLLRGTLHLVAAEDHAWLHALTAPLQAAGSARRLAQLGIAGVADRGVAAIERALADGPLDRAALAERIAAAGVRADAQRTPHLLGLAAQRGLIVYGPGAYVLARDWLPAAPPAGRDAALRELGARYLRGHAPAAPADLAAWSGLPLRDARAALDGAKAPRLAPAGASRAPAPARLRPLPAGLARPRLRRRPGAREGDPPRRRDAARDDPAQRPRRGHLDAHRRQGRPPAVRSAPGVGRRRARARGAPRARPCQARFLR